MTALALGAPSASAISYNFDFAFAGGAGSGPGQLGQPEGVAVDPSTGNVFVADTGNHRVQVFTATGAFVRQFGTLGSGPGQMTDPAAVGVSPVAPHDVYVADTNNNRIERFTNAGVFISAFGSNGSAPGQLELPRAITLDQAGNVYVADTGFNQRVSIFAPDGTFQSVVPTTSLTTFQFLAGLTSTPGPSINLFATDRDGNSAERFSPSGSTGGPIGTPGDLSAPAGIALSGNDSAAFLYVSDTGNHRVAIFGAGGPLIGSFGHCCSSTGGGEDSFETPSGVAYSTFNQHVYVADANNCCTRITAWKRIPDPQLGQSMDIQVDSGTVLFRPPGAKAFRKLQKVSLVKSGTIIDARRGTVGITSVTAKGQLQSADFYTGIFQAIQKTQGRGLTDAKLFGGSFKRCPAGARAAKNPQTVRQLWGRGAGQFRTVGRYAAAAIRGTTWLTDDRCDGTLIRVTQGAVAVRDLVKKKTIVVKAGQRYFARAPRR